MWVKPLLQWGHIFETLRDFKNWAPSELEEHREQLFRSLEGAKRHYRANFKDVEKQKLGKNMMMMYECMNYDLLTRKIYIIKLHVFD